MTTSYATAPDAAMNASTFFSSILGSIRQGVMVVDRDFRLPERRSDEHTG